MLLLGPKLKAARNAKKYTQEKMANMLHIHRTSYVKYETDCAQPPYEILCEICRILEISPNYLLEYTEDTED